MDVQYSMDVMMEYNKFSRIIFELDMFVSNKYVHHSNRLPGVLYAF